MEGKQSEQFWNVRRNNNTIHSREGSVALTPEPQVNYYTNIETEITPTMKLNQDDVCHAQLNTIRAHSNKQLNQLSYHCSLLEHSMDKNSSNCINLGNNKYKLVESDSDSDSYTFGDINESIESESESLIYEESNISQLNTVVDYDYPNTNIEYRTIGLGKEYISTASRYPPQLLKNTTVGAYDISTNTCTSHRFDSGLSRPIINEKDIEFVEIKNDNYNINHVMGDTEVEIITDNNKT